jgi:HD-GYP domain-containing protein (c-di-GMP phosphodiesterase class II)
MENSGTQFDPAIAKLFFEIKEQFETVSR